MLNRVKDEDRERKASGYRPKAKGKRNRDKWIKDKGDDGKRKLSLLLTFDFFSSL